MTVNLTHKIGHNLAHGSSKDEILQQVGNKSEGHADNSHHKITNGQGEQEWVGHRPHSLIYHQNHNDEQITKHAQQEYERV